MGKLARIVMDAFEVRHSHVGSKEVLRVHNKQGWVYQGHDWSNGTNENGDTVRCLSVSQMSEKIYNMVQRSLRRLQGYNPFHSNFKGIANSEQKQE
jgi:hypothetical protein